MYKIKVIKGDKNLNDIFVNILNDMICKNKKSMLVSNCTYKIPKNGVKSDKR